MIVGIVFINCRNHCVGIWKSEEHLRSELEKYATVTELHNSGSEPHEYSVYSLVHLFLSAAERRWNVQLKTDVVFSGEEESQFTWYDCSGGDVDGFVALEFSIDNVPGFVGFNDD